jgi:GNAT-family acetyltransferase (TIGR03103 family)
LIFAHTFEDPQAVVRALEEEQPGKRDIAFYISDPHVALSTAPQSIFLDPSHSYRLWLPQYRPAQRVQRGVVVRKLRSRADAVGINRIYERHGMARASEDFLLRRRAGKVFTYLVAIDQEGGEVVGTVMGIDHREGFNDPENGCSLWCLAVDPQAPYPGIGELLVRNLIERYQTRGRDFLDLSVMHDNKQAIALYEKLGFQRLPVFALKAKNSFNEALFTAPQKGPELNIYAQIIVDEARRRGIGVEVIDARAGLFRLRHGGRAIACRESLSELTSGVAMSCCDDKALTHRLLRQAGLSVPAQVFAGEAEANDAFLQDHGAVVVKPLRGEQGRGIAVDLRSAAEVAEAVEDARTHCEDVILESYVEGEDLRVIVIDYKVVAAATRRPPEIVGTGRHDIAALIAAQSRRRSAATGGESRIPVDAETRRCVTQAGYGLDDVLPQGEKLVVRKTANLHTGGTIHDVTELLHANLREAAELAARVLNIPVVGFDFIVERIDGAEYVIIEANERPGLANHEPAPTAQRFVDLLFPSSSPERRGKRGEVTR